MFALIFLVALISGYASSAPGKLPESFPRCKRSDPKVDECLVNAVQTSLDKLVPGIKGFSLFPLDPLRIQALDIAQGSGPVAIDLKFRDLDIGGLKNVKINKIKSDLNNYKLEIHANIPKPLTLDGQYEVKGNVLVLPLTGKGKSHLVLDNIKAKAVLEGKEIKKDGRSYMELQKFDVDYETSKLHMDFENLFSQDKALADNLNTFLNENWQEIHKEVQPAIRQALGTAFKEIASRILSKVPYDDIFLP